MSFFQKMQDHNSLSKAQEEAFYEIVYEEYENSPKRKGLWAQAIIKAGDSGNVDAIYLKLLADAMRNDAYLMKRIIESSDLKVENKNRVIDIPNESKPYISLTELEKMKYFSRAQLIPRIQSSQVDGYKEDGEWYVNSTYAKNLANK